MYESNGEKYFVVDGHMHYWNAAPDNWVPGAENYAERDLRYTRPMFQLLTNDREFATHN